MESTVGKNKRSIFGVATHSGIDTSEITSQHGVKFSFTKRMGTKLKSFDRTQLNRTPRIHITNNYRRRLTGNRNRTPNSGAQRQWVLSAWRISLWHYKGGSHRLSEHPPPVLRPRFVPTKRTRLFTTFVKFSYCKPSSNTNPRQRFI